MKALGGSRFSVLSKDISTYKLEEPYIHLQSVRKASCQFFFFFKNIKNFKCMCKKLLGGFQVAETPPF